MILLDGKALSEKEEVKVEVTQIVKEKHNSRTCSYSCRK